MMLSRVTTRELVLSLVPAEMVLSLVSLLLLVVILVGIAFGLTSLRHLGVAALLLPLRHLLLECRLLLRGLLLVGSLLVSRHGPPLLAGKLGHQGGLARASLLGDRLAIRCEEDPVAGRRLRRLSRGLEGLLLGLLRDLLRLAIQLAGLLVSPPLALHAACGDILLHGLLVLGPARGCLLFERGLLHICHGLPLRACELPDRRDNLGARLLCDSVTVLAQPQPVGVLRLFGLLNVRHGGDWSAEAAAAARGVGRATG
mmetsp:Transcript_66674/g.195660  ORF Transcript_66674/g.195660 Transcript_66674/m.195660 type:complete len:257 (+) Transcript_66674:3-773(+)